MTEQAGWVTAAGLTKRSGPVTAADDPSFSALRSRTCPRPPSRLRNSA